ILTSHMAGSLDTEGAFDFVISKMREGTEPLAHVHSREHEFMYLLSSMMRFYVENQVLAVMAGECMFLPRGVPHAFLIESKEIDIITLVSPGGFFDAVNKMSMPAKRMGLPADAETISSPVLVSQDRSRLDPSQQRECHGTRIIASRLAGPGLLPGMNNFRAETRLRSC